jgi:hypothetical protein
LRKRTRFQQVVVRITPIWASRFLLLHSYHSCDLLLPSLSVARGYTACLESSGKVFQLLRVSNADTRPKAGNFEARNPKQARIANLSHGGKQGRGLPRFEPWDFGHWDLFRPCSCRGSFPRRNVIPENCPPDLEQETGIAIRISDLPSCGLRPGLCFFATEDHRGSQRKNRPGPNSDFKLNTCPAPGRALACHLSPVTCRFSLAAPPPSPRQEGNHSEWPRFFLSFDFLNGPPFLTVPSYRHP